MTSPLLTVVICTFNRADRLPRCVGALLAQDDVAMLPWELLVVDNNSTDHTRRVVDTLASESILPVRYTFESRQGLNHARNHGIDQARGTYIAYIDDDIRVSAGWLNAVRAALRAHDPDAIGGRIHLELTGVLPPWIRGDMRGFLGHQDFGDEPFQMDGRRHYPFGGNMTIHRRVFERIGYFDTKLGRRGNGHHRQELFKGAETDLFHRLSANASRSIWYVPGAIVYHAVLPHQLHKRYFRTLHFNSGQQQARLSQTEFVKTIAGVPRFLLRQSVTAALRYLRQTIAEGPDQAFRQQMTLLHFLGQISGCRKRA
jgi:glycosyltransferase involved in cell wall biosynthesis